MTALQIASLLIVPAAATYAVVAFPITVRGLTVAPLARRIGREPESPR